MFYSKKLKRDILLEPHFLGPKFQEHVTKKLSLDLEGQCLGKLGYVIAVNKLEKAEISPGLIDNDTGSINITCTLEVFLLRPFKNEVLDAEVTMSSDENGFFARVGPLNIFISRHCMPDDMYYNNLNGEENWSSTDGIINISEGSLVRLRIIGLIIEAGVISAIGSIKESYLGQIAH